MCADMTHLTLLTQVLSEREKERESTGRGQRDSIIRGQGERQRGKQNLKRIPLAISHLGSKN